MSHYHEIDQLKLKAAALKRLHVMELAERFDPNVEGSKPTPQQEEILRDQSTLFRYVVAGNRSGKSLIGAREVAWHFTNTHPYFTRPPEWGDGPLMILVIGRVGEQIDSELWNNKIKKYLLPGTYREVRASQSLQRVENLENGNRIIFISHHNANEAREKAQAYTAHVVWVDEMPASISLITEIQLRIIANGGRFIATFTPLIRNDEIRAMIDSSDGIRSKKYKLSMLDNPLFRDRQEEALAAVAGASPEERAARLFGDWYMGSASVYDFRPDLHEAAPPQSYSRAWRHVLSVDPAVSGKLGMTIWAEDPSKNVWYCVYEAYLQGIQAPSDIVLEVEDRAKGYNIVRRIYDPHEAWYQGAAAKLGFTYMGVYKKNERKHELIKNLQQGLTDGRVKIAPWCVLIKGEFVGCQRAEGEAGKIINASKYHLLDSAQYFVDNVPRPDPAARATSFEERLVAADDARRIAEARGKNRATTTNRYRMVNRRTRWAR
jgi:phage terminase large subunit-like protein